ncbi:hypothetical protein DL93DRAFT_2171676 [Clavulina sp. PMI_390]|nr:hypothetical protein DL93DRAFT_2171676 [Clavulina sp. PMI_390]
MTHSVAASTPSPNLPWEIIDLIFEKSTLAALKSATLACHAMRREADRWLWAKAVLSFSFASSSELLLDPLPILPAERIVHVKSMNITFDPGLEKGLIAAFLFRQMLALIIAPAVHLTSLSMHLLLSPARQPPSSDLRIFVPAIIYDLFSVPCPSLTSLTIRGSYALGSRPLELHHIYALSTTHPLLEAIDMDIGLNEHLELGSSIGSLFPYLQSFHAHNPGQLALVTGSPLVSAIVQFELPYMHIPKIFTQLKTCSDTLKALQLRWTSRDTTSGFTAVIHAVLSGDFPNLETFSVNCWFQSRGYMKSLVLDRARECTLESYISRLAKSGRMPNLRIITLENIVIEDIERFGNHVFQSALSPLQVVVARTTVRSSRSLPFNNRLQTYHTIEKIFSDTRSHIVLHTGYQMVDGVMLTLVIAPAVHLTSLSMHLLLSPARQPPSADLKMFIPAIIYDLSSVPCPSLTSLAIRGSYALGSRPLELHHIYALSTTHPLLESIDMDIGLKEHLELDSNLGSFFPHPQSFHAHGPGQLVLATGSSLVSAMVRFELPYMHIPQIFTQLRTSSHSLKTLELWWSSLDTTSGFTAVIDAVLSGDFPNLETLLLDCWFMIRGYMKKLVIDEARGFTLQSHISRFAENGGMPNLRVIKLDNMVIEDIERFGYNIFRSAPSSLQLIVAKPTLSSNRPLPFKDRAHTYHTIAKIVTDTRSHIILHTVHQMIDGVEMLTSLATKQVAQS